MGRFWITRSLISIGIHKTIRLILTPSLVQIHIVQGDGLMDRPVLTNLPAIKHESPVSRHLDASIDGKDEHETLGFLDRNEEKNNYL